jgi:ABC-type glycerol-3-phosphate transport system permease component
MKALPYPFQAENKFDVKASNISFKPIKRRGNRILFKILIYFSILLPVYILTNSFTLSNLYCGLIFTSFFIIKFFVWILNRDYDFSKPMF